MSQSFVHVHQIRPDRGLIYRILFLQILAYLDFSAYFRLKILVNPKPSTTSTTWKSLEGLLAPRNVLGRTADVDQYVTNSEGSIRENIQFRASC